MARWSLGQRGELWQYFVPNSSRDAPPYDPLFPRPGHPLVGEPHSPHTSSSVRAYLANVAQLRPAGPQHYLPLAAPAVRTSPLYPVNNSLGMMGGCSPHIHGRSPLFLRTVLLIQSVIGLAQQSVAIVALLVKML